MAHTFFTHARSACRADDGALAEKLKRVSRSLRVAAVQLQAHDRIAFSDAFDTIVRRAGDAAANADLVVLPEATVPSYVLGSEPVDEAIVDDAVARLRETASTNDAVIVTGIAMRPTSGSMRCNAAIVIDRDGSLAGRADKLFLWHFDRRWFAAGNEVQPVQTSIGRLGVLICADGRIPTISRALVDRGAELLVMPTAWVTSGRNPRALENVQADLLARVRAFENGVPFVAANKCGTELGMVAYCGKSQIVSYTGVPLAIAGQFEPETTIASVTIGDAKPQRTAIPLPTPRPSTACGDARVAISAQAVADSDSRLEWLDAEFVVAPPLPARRLAALNERFPAAVLSAGAMLDPALPAAYRMAGCTLLIWQDPGNPNWTESIARARALELRAYVIVIDENQKRAFAVDPDGSIIAGTFGDYRIAAVGFDAARVAQTNVAPGSDVLQALERVAGIVGR